MIAAAAVKGSTMTTRTRRHTSRKRTPAPAPNLNGASTAAVEAPRPDCDPASPPMNAGKSKRTLTPDNFVKTVADVVASGPVLFEAAFHPRIPAALREKLFLAVSAVNDCRYCKWGHTHWAMAKGVPLEEVNSILAHQTASLVAKNPAEAAAILFGQHYAEQLDQFAPESVDNLREFYSDAEVAEILAYVRFITLANLTGNTVDAFLTGAHGQGKGSCFESVVAAAAAPVTILLTQLARCARQAGMDELRSRPHPDTPPVADTDGGAG